jgi:hypothetical protein
MSRASGGSTALKSFQSEPKRLLASFSGSEVRWNFDGISRGLNWCTPALYRSFCIRKSKAWSRINGSHIIAFATAADERAGAALD